MVLIFQYIPTEVMWGGQRDQQIWICVFFRWDNLKEIFLTLPTHSTRELRDGIIEEVNTIPCHIWNQARYETSQRSSTVCWYLQPPSWGDYFANMMNLKNGIYWSILTLSQIFSVYCPLFIIASLNCLICCTLYNNHHVTTNTL